MIIYSSLMASFKLNLKFITTQRVLLLSLATTTIKILYQKITISSAQLPSPIPQPRQQTMKGSGPPAPSRMNQMSLTCMQPKSQCLFFINFVKKKYIIWTLVFYDAHKAFEMTLTASATRFPRMWLVILFWTLLLVGSKMSIASLESALALAKLQQQLPWSFLSISRLTKEVKITVDVNNKCISKLVWKTASWLVLHVLCSMKQSWSEFRLKKITITFN